MSQGLEYKAFTESSGGGGGNGTCALAVYLHIPKTGGATQADEIFRVRARALICLPMHTPGDHVPISPLQNAWTSFATRLYRFGPSTKKRGGLPSDSSRANGHASGQSELTSGRLANDGPRSAEQVRGPLPNSQHTKHEYPPHPPHRRHHHPRHDVSQVEHDELREYSSPRLIFFVSPAL